MKYLKLLILVTVLLGTYAGAVPTQYATNTGGATYHYTPYGTVGTEFIMNENATLSSLGIWDENGNGLSTAHDVALFAMDGSVLASVTISAGTTNTMQDGYRWADTSPVSLTQGTHYVIGAYYPDGSDYFRTLATIDSAFTLVTDLYLDSSTFAIPTEGFFNDGVHGWYGGNLQILSGAQALNVVPAPGALLLGGIGVTFVGWLRRRRTL